jgi:hypothetical protein
MMSMHIGQFIALKGQSQSLTQLFAMRRVCAGKLTASKSIWQMADGRWELGERLKAET